MYRIELPRDLLVRLAKLRTQTGKPIAHQVREAVQEYCDRCEPRTSQERSD
jgi:predicted DNA-binding protein